MVGQVFFGSAEQLIAAFDFKKVVERLLIDVGRAHFWDITAVSAAGSQSLDEAAAVLAEAGVAVQTQRLVCEPQQALPALVKAQAPAR